MAELTIREKQRQATTLLEHCLGLPSGVATRRVRALTDQELDELLLVVEEPKRVRRQVLKTTLARLEDHGD